MRHLIHHIIYKTFLTLILFFYSVSLSFADNHNISKILEIIQKDIKTLEKAVYSRVLEFKC